MGNRNNMAFPLNFGQDDQGLPNCGEGLSKREYAAIQIMAGLAAFPHSIDHPEEIAVKRADELFNELEYTQKGGTELDK